MSQPARILVVDDDLAFREAMRLRLGAEGYEVAIAASGQEGLEAIAARAFDLVLLDMLMPGKGGFTTLQEIRANPATQRVPVILITAATDPGEWKSLTDATGGPTYIMGKPLEHGRVLERIREVLGASGGR
jgi:CheY-like chemotaxis protein